MNVKKKIEGCLNLNWGGRVLGGGGQVSSLCQPKFSTIFKK